MLSLPKTQSAPVRDGGHSVRDHTVRARYYRGLRNFFVLYAPIAHEWAFYDNSGAAPVRVARTTSDGMLEVDHDDQWNEVEEYRG